MLYAGVLEVSAVLAAAKDAASTVVHGWWWDLFKDLVIPALGAAGAVIIGIGTLVLSTRVFHNERDRQALEDVRHETEQKRLRDVAAKERLEARKAYADQLRDYETRVYDTPAAFPGQPNTLTVVEERKLRADGAALAEPGTTQLVELVVGTVLHRYVDSDSVVKRARSMSLVSHYRTRVAGAILRWTLDPEEFAAAEARHEEQVRQLDELGKQFDESP
jgi:hypothetical protein